MHKLLLSEIQVKSMMPLKNTWWFPGKIYTMQYSQWFP